MCQTKGLLPKRLDTIDPGAEVVVDPNLGEETAPTPDIVLPTSTTKRAKGDLIGIEHLPKE